MNLDNFIASKSLSIVIIGNFNPSIIQPFWLAKKELIREKEATEAEIEIIHNELVNFNLGWAKLDVRPDRFEITTNSEPFFQITIDLAIGIFSYLNETPASAVGINHYYHLDLVTKENHYKIGDKLAPLSNWKFLSDPRIINLEVVEKDRTDNAQGYYRIRVESSIEYATYGVNLIFNDHRIIDMNKSQIAKVITDNWNNARQRAVESFDKIKEIFES